MIDWNKPVRTVRSQRRLYVTGWGGRGMHPMLDTINNQAGTGFVYQYDGTPVDGCPWGNVENVPEDDVFVSTEWVEKRDAVDLKLRNRRQREAAELMERNNANNPLWGMF